MTQRYNPPPNWPQPPAGWTPPAGWQPDPAWGPPPPGWPVWADDVTQPSKPRPWGWIAGIVIAFLVGLGIGAAGGSDPVSTATAGKTATVTAAPEDQETTEAPVVEEPVAEYDDPGKKDFSLKVKTLSKQCFGSAGCNVIFRVSLGYDGLLGLDPEKTYEVTYEVRGGEDPMIQTLEATGDSYTVPDEQLISTTSSGAQLRAVVTAVEEL